MAPSLNLFLLFSISLLASIPFSSEAHDFNHEKHLHLYLHEINTGPNSTTAIVVPFNSTPSGFGGMLVIDDPLREGPESDSKSVARAQALLTGVSQEELTFQFDANFVFTAGEYNGSTLAVYGRIVLAAGTRDWTIIGGTGKFKHARGYVHGKKITPPAGEDLLIELDIYILHSFNQRSISE